ncbi:MAG: hypothetical protein Q4E10_01010 [Porphyromonas sp.]|nr:hypothetical protein [Porphyromonas sp.]
MSDSAIKKSSQLGDELLGVEELGDLLHPFFNTRVGTAVGKGMLKLLKVEDLDQIHAKCRRYTGVDVTSAILADRRVDVSYTVHGKEHLQRAKEMGAFYTVSNHPFGALDGVILIDIMGRVRDDYMVLVNGFLDRITALRDYWIPVVPEMRNRVHHPEQNVMGLKRVAERVIGGHPVGLFPAGGLPHLDDVYGVPLELPWKLSMVRILQRTSIPILPVMFEGNNSRRYYRFGERRGYNTAAILIPKEMLSKRGQNIDVYVGKPIMPDELEPYDTPRSLRRFLMHRSLGLLPSYRDKLDYLDRMK